MVRIMDVEDGVDSIARSVDNEPIFVESEELLQDGKMLPPTAKSFGSREELLQYVHDFSLSQGYATTIRDSEREKYVTIGCDRGGTYRDRVKVPFEERKKKSSSRLVNCPFQIKGVKLVNGSWTLRIKNGFHNHEASTDMSGHPIFRRFSKEELVRIKEMVKAGVPPPQILTSLRQANPELKAISRTVYNSIAKIRKEELEGRTPIQALLEELSQGGFTHNIKLDVDGRLTHLFFPHPRSVILSRSYSNIFVMDCTYKTNKFKMPLLDIIGVSSFNTSFYSSFAFLSKEEERDYVWALNMFKRVLHPNEPTVIVSDRELALMNAIKVVFPRTINLICFWHVETNILAHCKGHFKEEEDWECFLSWWTEVVHSDTVFSFNTAWEEFETHYKEKVVVINYIKNTWLPFKEYFAEAWADVHLHFGNQVTSRAEGAHAVLKRYLQVSTSDLHVAKGKICLAVENNFLEIKTQLASEKIKIPHSIYVPFFKEVVYRVSKFALRKLFEQYKLASSNSVLRACKGTFISTMGLPCAHVMQRMMSESRVLHPSDIHSQWRIDERSFEDHNTQEHNESDLLRDLIEELGNKYHQWPISQREAAQNKLSQLVHSSTPIVFDPIVQPHKGRPSKSKSKKTSNSTIRDPSAFELVMNSRKCTQCKGVGHNRRTCQHHNASTTRSQTHFVVPNPIDSRSSLDALDLNSMPSDVEHF